MRRLRFGLAVLALALAGSSDSVSAQSSCPTFVDFGRPYYTCGYTGRGLCDNCEYECSNGAIIRRNMCGGGGVES